MKLGHQKHINFKIDSGSLRTAIDIMRSIICLDSADFVFVVDMLMIWRSREIQHTVLLSMWSYVSFWISLSLETAWLLTSYAWRVVQSALLEPNILSYSHWHYCTTDTWPETGLSCKYLLRQAHFSEYIFCCSSDESICNVLYGI